MESKTNSLERELLSAAEKLENLANQMSEIYAKYGGRSGDIEEAGKNRTVSLLQDKGGAAYKGVLPAASELFSSWPVQKQIRACRQLRVAMEKAGFHAHNVRDMYDKLEEIESGRCTHSRTFFYQDFKTLVYGLRELVNENKNADDTDAYWDRIKYSTIIKPKPGYSIKAHFMKADERGCFNELPNIESDPFDIEANIDELVNSKVIFYPLQTKDDLVWFEKAWPEKPEIPFEFEMKTGVIKTIKAQEFYPLKRKNADYIKGFFRQYIFRSS